MRLFVSTIALFAISAPALAGCMAPSGEDTTDAEQALQSSCQESQPLPSQLAPVQPAECAGAPAIPRPDYSAALTVPGPTYGAPTYPGATYTGPTVTGPVYGSPKYQAPGSLPGISAPPCQAPTYSAPTFQGPTYQAPTYLGPTYLAPTYQAPIFEAPAQWLPAPINPCQQVLPTQAIPVPQHAAPDGCSHL